MGVSLCLWGGVGGLVWVCGLVVFVLVGGFLVCVLVVQGV